MATLSHLTFKILIVQSLNLRMIEINNCKFHKIERFVEDMLPLLAPLAKFKTRKLNQVFFGSKPFQTQKPQNAFRKTPQLKGKRTYLSPRRYNFEQDDNTKKTATNCHKLPTETFLEVKFPP